MTLRATGVLVIALSAASLASCGGGAPGPAAPADAADVSKGGPSGSKAGGPAAGKSGGPPGGGGAPARAALPSMPVAVTATQEVARVNGEAVPGKQLIDMWNVQAMQVATSGLLTDRQNQIGLERALLDILVDLTLVRQAAARDGVKPDPARVEAQLAQMKKNFPSEEKFQEGMKAAGVTLESVRSDIEKNLTVDAWFDRKIQGMTLTIRESEMKAFYDANLPMFQSGEEVHARQILRSFPETASAEERGDARRKIEEALAKVKGGSEFAAVAREYSTDVTATKGGDLGFFPRGKMVPQFEEAAFSLKPGEVSGIVESRFGFHIIKCEERKEATTMPFETVKADIRQIIEEQGKQELRKKLIGDLRATAEVQLLIDFPEPPPAKAGSEAPPAGAPAAGGL